MVDNPFFHRGPIKDQRYFFGRSMESRRLLRALRGGQSVSIVGPRRIGKSSLLFHIQDSQVRTQHKLGDEHFIIYLDCEGSGEATRSDLFQQWSEDIIWQMSSKGDEKRAHIEFCCPIDFADLRKTVGEATNQGWRLIFLLDEFEMMAANSNLDAGFFAQLRELTNSKNVAYVTATQAELYRLTCSDATVLTSPFFNFFSIMRLGLFQSHEAFQFVTKLSRGGGLEFSAETANFILHTAGYHPFFLHIVCERVFDYQINKPKLEENDYRLLTDEIRQELNSHFQYYWDRLDTEERQLLATLPRIQKYPTHKQFLLRALEQKCLIIKVDNAYDYVSSSFGDFVQEQSSIIASSPRSQAGYTVAQSLESSRQVISIARGSAFIGSRAMEAGLTGCKLGQYYLEEEIGRGNAATVYSAYQESLDRHVAIKVLKYTELGDESFYQRFIQEAHTCAQLNHPHILPLYDFGQEGGQPYIVMQYVEGGTLQERIQGMPLDLQMVRNITSQVCRALSYAHRHGVVHRDLKPANILIAEGDWALLADFGLAKMLNASKLITQSKCFLGTPCYMSPEQIQEKEVDGRSDIYSLGAVLYEMLTGHGVFTGNAWDVLQSHVSEVPRPPVLERPEIPSLLSKVVLRALSKDPAERYQSADEMNEALQAAIHPICSEVDKGKSP